MITVSNHRDGWFRGYSAEKGHLEKRPSDRLASCRFWNQVGVPACLPACLSSSSKCKLFKANGAAAAAASVTDTDTAPTRLVLSRPTIYVFSFSFDASLAWAGDALKRRWVSYSLRSKSLATRAPQQICLMCEYVSYQCCTDFDPRILRVVQPRRVPATNVV